MKHFLPTRGKVNNCPNFKSRKQVGHYSVTKYNYWHLLELKAQNVELVTFGNLHFVGLNPVKFVSSNLVNVLLGHAVHQEPRPWGFQNGHGIFECQISTGAKSFGTLIGVSAKGPLFSHSRKGRAYFLSVHHLGQTFCDVY